MNGGDAGDDHDVAGAGARTELAWSRSGLAVLTCLAAIAKRILPDLSEVDGRALLVTGLLVGGAAWMFALLWSRSIAAPALTGRRIADPRTMRAVALGTVFLGVVAIVLALLPDR